MSTTIGLGKRVGTLLIIAIVALQTGCDRGTALGEHGVPKHMQVLEPQGASPFELAFSTDPNPPTAGRNRVSVFVRKKDGTPLSNEAVTAVFYMPAMPAMNMPEMSNKFQLEAVGDGVYSGSGNLVMGGTWNVTVRVTQGDEELATRQFAVVAK